MQADRIVGVSHAPEERDQEANLRPAVESRVARERPGYAAQVERAQERVGVMVRADEDGAVSVCPAPRVLLGDHLRHPIGFARYGVEGEVLGWESHARLAVGPGRDQLLVDMLRHLEAVRIVVLDQRVGGVQHGLRRAPVLEEDDLPRTGIRPVEIEDVAHRGAAEPEDRLVIVSDHRHVPVLSGQELDHLELCVVGVLELVDEDEAIALLAAPEDVRPGTEESEHFHDLVAEVDLAEARHERLVLRVGARQLHVLLGLHSGGVVAGSGQQPLGVGQVLVRSHVLVLEPAEQRDHGLHMPCRVAQRPKVPERKLEEMIAQEDHLLGPEEQAEVRREPELERVLLDQPVAKGVEGQDLHIRVAVGHELVHALFHLGCGLVGERQREDLGGPGLARGDQVRDAVGDDGGLAGSRPRDDEQRPGFVGDGLALGLRQALQDPFGFTRDLRHRRPSDGSLRSSKPSARPARMAVRVRCRPRSCT